MVSLVECHTAGTARTICSVLLWRTFNILDRTNDIQDQTHSNTHRLGDFVNVGSEFFSLEQEKHTLRLEHQNIKKGTKGVHSVVYVPGGGPASPRLCAPVVMCPLPGRNGSIYGSGATQPLYSLYFLTPLSETDKSIEGWRVHRCLEAARIIHRVTKRCEMKSWRPKTAERNQDTYYVPMPTQQIVNRLGLERTRTSMSPQMTTKEGKMSKYHRICSNGGSSLEIQTGKQWKSVRSWYHNMLVHSLR